MDSLSHQHSNALSKYFIISSETRNELKTTSPILIHKSIISIAGEVKSIKKLSNGNILIEVLNSKQAEHLMKLEKIGNIKVTVSPHHTLNHSKGVISESEFQRDLEEDLLECLKPHNVIAVKRITIKRNGQIFPTKHLILTFNNPVLPKNVKIAYINCPVKPYIPDPLRCFKCQKFGHTTTACRGNKEICARCSLSDHNSQICKSTTQKCFNFSADHPSYSRSCPRYKLEKEIQTIKITKKISFQEARQIVIDRTPIPGLSYSSALNSTAKPLVQNNLKTSQIQPTVVNNTSASPAIVNPATDTDTITIKKSDWLALLAIKKSWEDMSKATSVSRSPSNPTPMLIPQSIVPCPTVNRTEFEKSTPVPPTTNSLNIPIVSNASSIPSTYSLKNSSIPETPKIKSTRDNKKQTKKSNQLTQAKESKEEKRARILAAKRDQSSLGDGSLSREDFLKDSVKTNKIGDDDDSDSLLKVHPSEDDMSTSEVDEPPLSS
ncbi:hypothetical protein AVEN_131895-1 [Araneus ventricosus]|uniref:CCHC-type domain-containing protein n=1 Tax=Araneus ventricosus TaxID=182803 RepID=A0A4Y2N966_ARAVE|nr:hypothetical protein AVEN_131895-1 [Araneus ventricosus]